MTSRLEKTLHSMNVRQLKEVAKDVGIEGFSNLKKQELIERLSSNPSVPELVNPSWWSTYHNHVYGGATILALAASIVFYLMPNDKNTNIKPDKSSSIVESTIKDETVTSKEVLVESVESVLAYSNTFDGEYPYPRKFQKIKIGSDAEAVKDIYPNAKLTDGGQAFAIAPAESIFWQVVFGFHYQASDNNRKITSIYFYVRDKFKKQFRAEIVDMLQSYESSRDGLTGEINWLDIEGLSVKISADEAYIIKKSQ